MVYLILNPTFKAIMLKNIKDIYIESGHLVKTILHFRVGQQE